MSNDGKLAVLVLAASIAVAQTRLDLGTQTKNVDFSAAQVTKPVKTGSFLPPVCSVGEMYLLVTAPAGSNIYTCIATNTWVSQGGALPSAPGAGQILISTGADGYEWRSLSGDVVSGTQTKVTGLQGNPVSSVRPAKGQVLTWDDASGAWAPQPQSLALQVDGLAPSGASSYNQVTGSGMVTTTSEGGGTFSVQQDVNTAIVQTRAGAQSGSDLLIGVVSDSSTAFVGRMTPALGRYTDGMVVQFRPNRSCSGAVTLDIDTLGAKPVFDASGTTPLTCTSGEQVALWYDGPGGQWRRQGSVTTTSSGGSSGEGITDPGSNGVMVRTAVNTTGVVPGSATDFVRVDGTSAAIANFPVATQAEAEAGSAANRYMTPERTKQAITAQRGNVVPDPGSNGVVVRTGLNTAGVVTGNATDFVRVDGTSAAIANFPVATQAEAEAGTVANRYMTPERTKQAITAQRGNVVPDPGSNGVVVRTGLNTAGVVPGSATNFVRVDGTSAAIANFPVATQAEAEAGTAANRYMTPERTKQAITAQRGNVVPDPGSNGVVVRTGLNTAGVVTGNATDFVRVDGTSAAIANFPAATQAEAEAGTVANRSMTPERTKQAIAAQRPPMYVAMQGLSPTTQVVNAGATSYVALSGSLASASGRRASRVQVAGTLKDAGMGFSTTHVDPAMTCTLIYSANDGVNWAPSTIQITVNSAGTSGANVNAPKILTSPNTLNVGAGWLITWECVNGSAVSSSGYFMSFATIQY